MRDIFKDYKVFAIDPTKLRSPGFFRNMLEYRKIVMRQYRVAVKPRGRFQCLLCNTQRGKDFLRYKNYQLLECTRCGLVSPNIDFAKVNGQKLYDDPACVRDTTREVLDTYKYRKRTYAPERLQYILDKTDLVPKKIRLLDVGCGPGYFLSYLQDKKIKYKGLELAKFLVEICQQKGLNVGMNEISEEPDQAYNIITMFDVLEHIVNPVSLMKTLNRKLIKGGFVLAYVPNIHSLAYHLMGEYQNTLVPFQHFGFYDPASLQYLARQSGFTIHSLDYYGLDLMDYLYMKADQDEVNYHKNLATAIPLLQAVLDKQKLSNHMRVVFQKSKK